MASTRNKNTKEDYLLEQKMNRGRQTYIHYTNLDMVEYLLHYYCILLHI